MFSFYVNSPYYFLHISFNVSYENLVVHQDNIHQLMTVFVLNTWLMDNGLTM